MTRRFLEWRDVDEAINRLATNITNSGKKISAIKGIARGGLIPAVMLSHKLNVPFLSEEDLDEGEGYLLIVDDICDSGVTLQQYEEFKDNILTVTLHYKNSALVEPDFWWRLASAAEWIVYPWENKNSKTIQDYAAKREQDK